MLNVVVNLTCCEDNESNRSDYSPSCFCPFQKFLMGWWVMGNLRKDSTVTCHNLLWCHLCKGPCTICNNGCFCVNSSCLGKCNWLLIFSSSQPVFNASSFLHLILLKMKTF